MAQLDGHTVIENDFARAVVSPRAGAALRSFRVRHKGKELELLRGGDAQTLDPAMLQHGTGSFIMAPWPNRIPHGELLTSGGHHVLRDGEARHTIHGLVRDKTWELSSHSADSACFRVDLPKPWPYAGSVTYEIGLDGPSLVQSLTVESTQDEFPAGAGWHPWFRHSLGGEGVRIELNALETWVLDEHMTPNGELDRPPLVEQIRNGARLKPGTADDCFRIMPGTKTTLTWPEITLEIVSSETVTHVMVYTPPDGSALCVEPQTCTVNAFQLHARGVPDTGTQFVRPGQPLKATTIWSWR